MASKQQVIETHQKHPDWSANEIARSLQCSAGYVRATARRLRFSLPRSKPESIEALGRAAMDAGLTIESIQAIAKLNSPALTAVVATALICASAIAGYVAGGSL